MSLTQRICLLILVPVAFSILSGLITNSTPQDSTEVPPLEEEVLSSIFKGEPAVDVCKSNEKTESENENIRPTPVCNATAASVLEKMDATANPCDDFYKFACGSFVKNTVVPGDRSREDMFTLLADKVHAKLKKIVEAPISTEEIKPFQYVKQFYQRCVNATEIELTSIATAKKILNQIGNWPALQGEEWKSDEFDINNVTYKLRQMGLPFENIISVYIDRMLNTSNNSIYISYPTLSLENEYLIAGLTNSLVETHYNFIVNISVAIGAERNFSRKEFNDSMLFEIQLANIIKELQNDRKNSSGSNYNETTIKDLNLLHPFIPWEDYINHIVIANKSVHVGPNETVYITKHNFIGKIEKLLSVTPKRVQANYIFSRILQFISPLLSEEIQNYILESDRNLSGITEKPLRCKECFNILPEGLLKAIGALYIRNFSDIENKKLKVVELTNTLKLAFINVIKESTWMDENAKLQAVEKANSMRFDIGFPSELLDDEVLEQFYKNLTITPSDNSLDIFLKVNKFIQDILFSNYGQSYEKSFWANDQTTAFRTSYSLLRNTFNIPAVFFENESYDINKPRYMNYGGLGFLIASGMAHGFNNQGRMYDKNGLNNDWWQSSTKTEFDRKSQCLIDKYSQYTVPKLNLHVNGSMTLEENIVNNAAIRTTYMAYQSWVNENGVEQALPGVNYTSNQLFWISSAQYMCSVSTEEHLKEIILTDNHPPFEFRVNGAFSNSKDFAKDFNCPSGSQMNPENKCQIW